MTTITHITQTAKAFSSKNEFASEQDLLDASMAEFGYDIRRKGAEVEWTAVEIVEALGHDPIDAPREIRWMAELLERLQAGYHVAISAMWYAQPSYGGDASYWVHADRAERRIVKRIRAIATTLDLELVGTVHRAFIGVHGKDLAARMKFSDWSLPTPSHHGGSSPKDSMRLTANVYEMVTTMAAGDRRRYRAMWKRRAWTLTPWSNLTKATMSLGPNDCEYAERWSTVRYISDYKVCGKS
jgi:hypothetical protein